MLEESTVAMEKKSTNRQSSAPLKQNVSESKKSDNGSQKQVSSKYAKRRENNGNKSYYQDASPRRPTPQKQRYNVDKRPRPRGGGYPREEVTEEYPIDYGSPLLKGKKVNLNHLLNFSYARAETFDEPQHWRGGVGAKGSGRRRQSGRLRYNKEQFLQANCQFIVKENVDYAIHNIDPDKLVDWEAVELIRMNSHEVSSCPICLEKPLAAKMTRCGHVYCWPCILHYLALGEKSWRKCPICYESVHENDLKSVMMQEVHKFSTGETIKMSLMRREKGMTYALPKYLWEKKEGIIHSYNDKAKKTNFLKLLSISEEDVLTFVLGPERLALQQKLREAETSEVAFIDSALHLLKTREQSIVKSRSTSTRSSSTTSSSSTEEVEIPVVRPKLSPSTETKAYSSAFSDEEEEMDVLPQTGQENPIPESVAIEPQANNRPSGINNCSLEESGDKKQNEEVGAICGSPQDPRQSPPIDLIPDSLPVEEAAEHLEMPLAVDDQQNKKRPINDNAFYFYQASDGQHIYLHALNARCLVKEYGSLSECPQTITANIVQMENIFMTEELRKRLRYLGHLPLTCEFEVAELALKPPVISKDTTKFFSEEIDKRRRLRQKKNREEKRWNRRAQDEENKQMAKYNIYGTDSRIVQSQFVPGVLSINRPISPAAKSDDSSQSMSSINTPVGSPLVDTEVIENIEGQQTSGFSFAQMLKAGQAKAPTWPKVKTKAEATSPPDSSRSKDSDGSDNEDKVPVPMFRESFGDAIQLALDSHMALAQGDTIEVQPTEKNKGKKKKKQQKLLFATTMARGGK